jgi:hypothetical protein
MPRRAGWDNTQLLRNHSEKKKPRINKEWHTACFLVVIPTLHGYWEMGRQTSLNPLEIVKAFNVDLP